MSLVGNFGNLQQVIATEYLGGFPVVSILVNAAELHAEAWAARFGFIFPDCGLDGTEPDLMYWFVVGFHFVFCFCIFVGGKLLV